MTSTCGKLSILLYVILIVIYNMMIVACEDQGIHVQSLDENHQTPDLYSKTVKIINLVLGKRTLCQFHNASDVKKSDLVKPMGSHPLGRVYGFIHGFVASVSVIIVSELGDKTFFIAAIMAMRYSRMTVFAGALGALGLMTVLSAALGYATTIVPRKITFYVSTALFVYFGVKMLHEGYKMDPNEGQEEYEEVQAELKKKEEELQEMSRTSVIEDPESGIIKVMKRRRHCFGLVSPIFVQSFSLTFLAEWGDRSQLATIILATREDVLGVTLGGTLGHALCTGLAVIGGRLIAQKISVKSVTLIGGVVFLLFAVSSLIIGP